MKRGDIWWGQLPEPVGTRPVLLLSRDEVYRARQFVVVSPLSTRIRDVPAEVPLGIGDGMPKPCAVNLDTLMTVAKASLTNRITALSAERMQQVEAAIRFALDLH